MGRNCTAEVADKSKLVSPRNGNESPRSSDLKNGHVASPRVNPTLHITKRKKRPIMQLLRWLSVLAFGLLVSAQQSPPPKELEIKTTYTPSDCTAKANKGDAI